MKKLQRILLVIIGVLFITGPAWGKHLHPEKFYQDAWYSEQQGQTEVIMPDGTRCDCLTEEYACEVDFSMKFYEGISQALYYAMHTGKQAALLLIVEKPGD